MLQKSLHITVSTDETEGSDALAHIKILMIDSAGNESTLANYLLNPRHIRDGAVRVSVTGLEQRIVI